MIKAVCLSSLCFSVLSFAMTVEYFGLSNQPPIDSAKTPLVCLLDKPEKIKTAINQDLKEQMEEKQMSASDITQRYKSQFKALSNHVICQYEAAKLGVESLPAIVINHRYVIYGQQNIDLAIQEYQAYWEREHVE